MKATSWSNEDWQQGNVIKTPNNPGRDIPGAIVDGAAVGYKVASEGVEETEVDL